MSRLFVIPSSTTQDIQRLRLKFVATIAHQEILQQHPAHRGSIMVVEQRSQSTSRDFANLTYMISLWLSSKKNILEP